MTQTEHMAPKITIPTQGFSDLSSQIYFSLNQIEESWNFHWYCDSENQDQSKKLGYDSETRCSVPSLDSPHLVPDDVEELTKI